MQIEAGRHHRYRCCVEPIVVLVENCVRVRVCVLRVRVSAWTPAAIAFARKLHTFAQQVLKKQLRFYAPIFTATRAVVHLSVLPICMRAVRDTHARTHGQAARKSG